MHTELMSPVRLRITEIREVKGWSQAELARRSGVPQPTISRLESGKTRTIDLDNLENLADALGVDAGYLIVHERAKRGRRTS